MARKRKIKPSEFRAIKELLELITEVEYKKRLLPKLHFKKTKFEGEVAETRIINLYRAIVIIDDCIDNGLLRSEEFNSGKNKCNQ
jgi:hypothetical protein